MFQSYNYSYAQLDPEMELQSQPRKITKTLKLTKAKLQNAQFEASKITQTLKLTKAKLQKHKI